MTLEQNIYTVSRLNQAVRLLLEGSFSLVWVEGEISNLSRPTSGHLYFSLKDVKAQIRCALFRNRAMLSRRRIENGLKVVVRARVSLYEPRGDFQLIVEQLEEAGDGALRLAYDELRRRLENEGLFDPGHKRPLPRFPHRIGVITSPTGAAIRDVLSVLQRRFPAVPVLVYPVLVQGDGAGTQIACAVELASRRKDCDVLLLVRGGGSLEDLWAFNDERLARAIYACEIPLVCGVGHETDVTIADFAADLRAPTPSAAAELISPDRLEWLARFTLLQSRLHSAEQQRLAAQRLRLVSLQQRLHRQHPGRRLQDRAQRLDELEQRLARAVKARLERLEIYVANLRTRLRAQTPDRRIRHLQEQRQTLAKRLEAVMRQRLDQNAQRFAAAGRALHTVSPLQTLGRGYAIVRGMDGTVIRHAQQTKIGDQVEALLGEGKLFCQVTKITE